MSILLIQLLTYGSIAYTSSCFPLVSHPWLGSLGGSSTFPTGHLDWPPSRRGTELDLLPSAMEQFVECLAGCDTNR